MIDCGMSVEREAAVDREVLAERRRKAAQDAVSRKKDAVTELRQVCAALEQRVDVLSAEVAVLKRRSK